MNNEINLDMAITEPVKEKTNKLDEVRLDVMRYEKNNEDVSPEYIYDEFESAIKELQEKHNKDYDYEFKRNQGLVKELQEKEDEIIQLKTDKQNHLVEIAKLQNEIDYKDIIIAFSDKRILEIQKDRKDRINKLYDKIKKLKDELKKLNTYCSYEDDCVVCEWQSHCDKLKQPIKIDDDIIENIKEIINDIDVNDKIKESSLVNVELNQADKLWLLKLLKQLGVKE
jgi:hypothetical protein